MCALTLRSSNKVEVHSQVQVSHSGWFKYLVSEYHAGLKTAPFCCTSEAKTDNRYQHVADSVTRGCKVAANGKVGVG